MNSFEINKIIASILLVVFLVIGVNKIGDIIFEVKKPQVAAYKVEGLATTVAASSSG